MNISNWFVVNRIEYVITAVTDDYMTGYELLDKYLADVTIPDNTTTWSKQLESLKSEYMNNHEQIFIQSTLSEKQAEILVELIEINNINNLFPHSYLKTIMDYGEVSTKLPMLSTKQGAEVLLTYLTQYINENFKGGISLWEIT